MKLPRFGCIFLICCAIFAKTFALEPLVVCYYTNWSVYRVGEAKFKPQNIPPYLCTHLIYAFGGIAKGNTIAPLDEYQDIQNGGYATFTGLKTHNKNLKTLIAIGGSNEPASTFSRLVSDAERRSAFVKNAVTFLRQHNFDGLDLVWQYPIIRSGRPTDRINYAQFVQELREEFDRESSSTQKPRLLLTLAMATEVDKIEQGYDIVKLNKYVDWFNVLTYNFHESSKSVTTHHAPLFPLNKDNTQRNIDFIVGHLLDSGADPHKIVIGIPTFGRSYTLLNVDSHGIGAPANGPGKAGNGTGENGFLAYFEICKNTLDNKDWIVIQPDDKVGGPYAFKDDQWVSYDDEHIVRRKAEYVGKNCFGGVMFWALDTDDFQGVCVNKPYPLIEAAKDGLYNASQKTDCKRGEVNNRPRNPSTESSTIVSNSGTTSPKLPLSPFDDRKTDIEDLKLIKQLIDLVKNLDNLETNDTKSDKVATTQAPLERKSERPAKETDNMGTRKSNGQDSSITLKFKNQPNVEILIEDASNSDINIKSNQTTIKISLVN